MLIFLHYFRRKFVHQFSWLSTGFNHIIFQRGKFPSNEIVNRYLLFLWAVSTYCFRQEIRKMRTPLEIHRIFVEIDTAQNNYRHTATIDCRSLHLFCAFLWNHRQTNSAWTSPSNFYTSNCLYLIRCYY